MKPVINTFVYAAGECHENQLRTTEEISKQLQSAPEKFHWIDVHGFGDQLFLEQLADSFGIHRLQIEDVVNGY